MAASESREEFQAQATHLELHYPPECAVEHLAQQLAALGVQQQVMTCVKASRHAQVLDVHTTHTGAHLAALLAYVMRTKGYNVG